MKMMLIHTITYSEFAHHALPQLILCSSDDCGNSFDRECTAFYEAKRQSSCRASALIYEEFEI